MQHHLLGVATHLTYDIWSELKALKVKICTLFWTFGLTCSVIYLTNTYLSKSVTLTLEFLTDYCSLIPLVNSTHTQAFYLWASQCYNYTNYEQVYLRYILYWGVPRNVMWLFRPINEGIYWTEMSQQGHEKPRNIAILNGSTFLWPRCDLLLPVTC